MFPNPEHLWRLTIYKLIRMRLGSVTLALIRPDLGEHGFLIERTDWVSLRAKNEIEDYVLIKEIDKEQALSKYHQWTRILLWYVLHVIFSFDTYLGEHMLDMLKLNYWEYENGRI